MSILCVFTYFVSVSKTCHEPLDEDHGVYICCTTIENLRNGDDKASFTDTEGEKIMDVVVVAESHSQDMFQE